MSENVASALDSNIALNERSLSVARLSVAKLTAAQQRSLARLSDDFKREYNASALTLAHTLSDWVAYKLSCCSAAQQSALYALYVAQSRRIVTADIDAVKRNAFASNLDVAERVDFASAATVENVAALRNNVARIVVRERRSTETRESVDALANARASSQLDSIARDAADALAAAQRENVALTNALLAQSARVSALSSAHAVTSERVDAAERVVSTLDARSTLSAADALKRLAAERANA